MVALNYETLMIIGSGNNHGNYIQTNLFEQNNFLGNVIKKGVTALRINHPGRRGNKEMTNGGEVKL